MLTFRGLKMNQIKVLVASHQPSMTPRNPSVSLEEVRHPLLKTIAAIYQLRTPWTKVLG